MKFPAKQTMHILVPTGFSFLGHRVIIETELQAEVTQLAYLLEQFDKFVMTHPEACDMVHKKAETLPQNQP